MSDRVPEVVAMLLEQLRAFVEGDELALNDLSDALDQSDYDTDDVDAAFDFIFQALEPVSRETYAERRPGTPVQRVLSEWERLALSSEAYGYLLSLRETGVLTDEQLEMVLEHAAGSRSQNVAMEDVRDIAGDVLFSPFEHKNVHEPTDTQH